MSKAKKINEVLRRARIERGWTQKDLAEQIDVAESTVRSWEQRTRTPGPELLARLSSALGKSLEELDLLPPPDVAERKPVEGSSDVLTTGENPAITNQPPMFLFQHGDINRYRMIQRVQ